jgi:Tol biopolymer transport system component
MNAHPRLALILAAGAALSACTTSTQQSSNFGSAEPAAISPTSPATGSHTTTTGSAGATGADPLALSTAGFSTGRTAGTVYPTGDATSFNLYRDVFATSTNSRPATGSGNMSQVSFSLEGSDFDPDVSRDGGRIVFASTQHRPTPDIYVKSVDGRVVTQLTNDPACDVMPRISPDGTRVAFSSNRAGNWDIYVMPIAGGKAVQVTSSSADDLHPSWSPDGSQIVFCRSGEVSGQWEMWVCDVANSGIARFIGYGLFPEWCPVQGTGSTGTDRIAFQKSRERGDRAFAIWTIDFRDGQAGNTTEIASSPVAACINPSWSHDGKWLAFSTVPNPGSWNDGNSRPASANLWMVDVTGSSRISLTSDPAVDLMPCWGPSNKLYFVSDRAGVDNIWCMDTTPMIKLAAVNAASGRTAFASSAPTTTTTTTPGEHSAPTTSTTTTHEAPVATVPTSGEPSSHDPH